jgi:O-acetyl-ADP-ribose deacetylase (regulator of RNase III)
LRERVDPRVITRPHQQQAMRVATAQAGSTRLDVIVADITTLEVDAIVNAANSSLLGGGGVDGAIHRAAGPELRRACQALGGAETGEAKITPGFKLKARYVIHAVGPVWHGGRAQEGELLASCYRTAIALASEKQATSLAFPAISTGVYRFPPDRAARIAVDTVLAELAARETGLKRVIFCCFSDDSAGLHHDAFVAQGLI